MAKFNHIKSRTWYYGGEPRTDYGFNKFIDGKGMDSLTEIVKVEGGWEAYETPRYGEEKVLVAKAASLAKMDEALTVTFADWNNF